MDNFSEFERPIGPEKNSSSIISHAWKNFKGVFLYGIVYLLFAFLISYIISLLFPGMSLSPGTMKEIIESYKSGNVEEIQDIISTSHEFNMTTQGISTLASFVGSALLYPLTAGLVYINHKHNSGKEISFMDLLIGYKQNTLHLILYGLIISFLAGIGTLFCILPGIYFYLVGFVGLPIVFFGNKTTSEGLRESFKYTKENFGLALTVGFIGLLISISGILLCGMGILFTFPFIYSASYSLYCAIFGTPYEINAD